MKKLIVLLILMFNVWEGAFSGNSMNIEKIHSKLRPARPSHEIFIQAVEGYRKIEKTSLLNQDKPLITIIDLNIPSSRKRLWVIDMEQNKVLFNTYVSHGRNSGDLCAERFSNISGSCQTSLGFYLTGATYTGKNGYSMYLDGLEMEFNNRARERAIVMYGAW